MPDPYERHARPGKHAYYGEDPKGSRSQTRDAAASDDPVRGKVPGKKDRDLCKGQHWKGPHTPEVTLGRTYISRTATCGWRVDYANKMYWFCQHALTCSGCGKDFGGASKGQCPLYHDITPAEQAWITEEIRKREERRADWRARWKPGRGRVITGPQGYRKKKA